jgi:radical SAM superfamily enzyme YgiQ (UPF0313 family)
MEPLALCILAGLTPDHVDLVAYDDRFEALPFDEPWDLVALSVQTFAARRAYEIADAFRARGVPVVLGGFHPTLCPDEAAEHADAVALGEAESTWPHILADARRGALQPRYQASSGAGELHTQPDRSILAGKRYLPLSPVELGRGCPHRCEFCSVSAFYPVLRHRPIDAVLADIAACGHRFLFFTDDNLFADRARAITLLRALQPLGLRWCCQASVDLAADPELLDLLAAAGCQVVMLGLESVRPDNLVQMGKGWARKHDLDAAIGALSQRGIATYAGFVFGYDADTPDVFAATRELIWRSGFFIVNSNHLQPYPGTPLYCRLQAEGRLVYERWWLDPAYRFGEVVFHPRGMSADQLSQGCADLRAQVHGLGGIVRRLGNRSANASSVNRAMLYLAANLVSRNDIGRKRSLRLGHAHPTPGSLA